MRKSFCGIFFFYSLCYLLFSHGTGWPEAKDQYHEAEELLATGHISWMDRHHPGNVRGANGRYYDAHGILNPLIFVGPALVARVLRSVIAPEKSDQIGLLLAGLTGAIVMALTLALFYGVVCKLGHSHKIAVLSTLIVGLSSMLFAYASTNYEGTLFLFASVGSLFTWLLYQSNQKSHVLIATGFLSALAPLTRDIGAVYFILFASFVVVRLFLQRNPKLFSLFALGAATPILVWFLHNYLRTKNIFFPPMVMSAGVGAYENLRSTNSILLNVVTLAFSPGGSILFFNPILIFSLLGYRRFLNSHPWEAGFSLLFSLVILLINVRMANVLGEYSNWGPRYTLEILCFLFLGLPNFLGELIKNQSLRQYKQFLLIVMFLGGVLIQVSGTLAYWQARQPKVIRCGNGSTDYIWTIRCSAWWDAVRSTGIKIWNGTFAQTPLEDPGYDIANKFSEDSRKTARSFYTWWNRLLYMGFPKTLIWLFVIACSSVAGTLLYQLFEENRNQPALARKKNERKRL